MLFTKMHGLGNDYVFVEVFTQRVDDPADIARRVSDRHTGIGADGLILIGPSAQGPTADSGTAARRGTPAHRADVRMTMFNADGSRAQMCGNGLRCVAKYAVEHGLASGPEVSVETDAGVRHMHCHMSGDKVDSVRVNMGRPVLSPASIPVNIEAKRIVDHPICVIDRTTELPTTHRITCVNMGNPHAIEFVEDVAQVDPARVGPLIERAAVFPERVNVHFVQVDTPSHVTMVTWERGSGITRACGSGACAVCVAGVQTGRTGREIVAKLPGGELRIEWSHGEDRAEASSDPADAGGDVFMTGPAVEVFTGEWTDGA